MQPNLKTELNQYSEFQDSDSAKPEECLLLYALVRAIKPKFCVETGTHRAFSSMYIGQALKENGEGKLITCDPNDEWGAGGNLRKTDLEKYVKYMDVRGDELIVEEPIDFLFVDGLHEKEEVISELKHFMPHLADEAVVVFHDCAGDGKTVGTNGAIKEMGLEAVFIPTYNVMRIYCKRDENKRGHPVNSAEGVNLHPDITGESEI